MTLFQDIYDLINAQEIGELHHKLNEGYSIFIRDNCRETPVSLYAKQRGLSTLLPLLDSLRETQWYALLIQEIIRGLAEGNYPADVTLLINSITDLSLQKECISHAVVGFAIAGINEEFIDIHTDKEEFLFSAVNGYAIKQDFEKISAIFEKYKKIFNNEHALKIMKVNAYSIANNEEAVFEIIEKEEDEDKKFELLYNAAGLLSTQGEEQKFSIFMDRFSLSEKEKKELIENSVFWCARYGHKAYVDEMLIKDNRFIINAIYGYSSIGYNKEINYWINQASFLTRICLIEDAIIACMTENFDSTIDSLISESSKNDEMKLRLRLFTTGLYCGTEENGGDLVKAKKFARFSTISSMQMSELLVLFMQIRKTMSAEQLATLQAISEEDEVFVFPDKDVHKNVCGWSFDGTYVAALEKAIARDDHDQVNALISRVFCSEDLPNYFHITLVFLAAIKYKQKGEQKKAETLLRETKKTFSISVFGLLAWYGQIEQMFDAYDGVLESILEYSLCDEIYDADYCESVMNDYIVFSQIYSVIDGQNEEGLWEIINNGRSLFIRNEEGESPVELVAKTSGLSKVKFLIKNFKEESEVLLLIEIVKGLISGGHDHEVKCLINDFAPISFRSKIISEALTCYAMTGKNDDFVEYYLKEGGFSREYLSSVVLGYIKGNRNEKLLDVLETHYQEHKISTIFLSKWLSLADFEISQIFETFRYEEKFIQGISREMAVEGFARNGKKEKVFQLINDEPDENLKISLLSRAVKTYSRCGNRGNVVDLLKRIKNFESGWIFFVVQEALEGYASIGWEQEVVCLINNNNIWSKFRFVLIESVLRIYVENGFRKKVDNLIHSFSGVDQQVLIFMAAAKYSMQKNPEQALQLVRNANLSLSKFYDLKKQIERPLDSEEFERLENLLKEEDFKLSYCGSQAIIFSEKGETQKSRSTDDTYVVRSPNIVNGDEEIKARDRSYSF